MKSSIWLIFSWLKLQKSNGYFQEQTQHPFYLLPDNLLVAPLALGDDIRIWQDRFQGNLITSLLNLLFKS